jgi:outer membrane murein-binding lipoprotein Lpp
MAPILLCAALAAAQEAPAPAPAQEPAPNPQPAPTTAAPAKPKPAPAGESPLVAAAKKAKGGKIQAGVVVTNENLKQFKGSGGSVTYASPSDPNAPAYSPAESHGGAGTQEQWQQRMSSARGAVSNAESRIASLQAKVNKLESDFYAWDDPAYRDGVIKPAWDQVLADLQAAQQGLEAAKQRLADLEEEARKAGVPPGWLR